MAIPIDLLRLVEKMIYHPETNTRFIMISRQSAEKWINWNPVSGSTTPAVGERAAEDVMVIGKVALHYRNMKGVHVGLASLDFGEELIRYLLPKSALHHTAMEVLKYANGLISSNLPTKRWLNAMMFIVGVDISYLYKVSELPRDKMGLLLRELYIRRTITSFNAIHGSINYCLYCTVVVEANFFEEVAWANYQSMMQVLKQSAIYLVNTEEFFPGLFAERLTQAKELLRRYCEEEYCFVLLEYITEERDRRAAGFYE